MSVSIYHWCKNILELKSKIMTLAVLTTKSVKQQSDVHLSVRLTVCLSNPSPVIMAAYRYRGSISAASCTG